LGVSRAFSIGLQRAVAVQQPIWFQAMSRGQSGQLGLAALNTFPEVVDGAQVGRVLADPVL